MIAEAVHNQHMNLAFTGLGGTNETGKNDYHQKVSQTKKKAAVQHAVRILDPKAGSQPMIGTIRQNQKRIDANFKD